MRRSVAVGLGVVLVVAGGLVVPRLAGHGELDAPDGPTRSPVVRDGHQDPPVLLAAGDIADCENGAPSATAELVDRLEGTVAALGDLAYPAGTAEDFAGCYAPTWGPLRDRTRPAPGNHDVMTDGGAAYYRYFGGLAGRDGQGWYSYDLGDWHVVVLNSNCELVGGCDADSPQVAWLREDLAGAGTANILAYWHHPRFSSGQKSGTEAVAAFWEVLHRAGADVTLHGHDHNYQRFTPLDADGRPDPAGIRQFVVGTGGAELYTFGPSAALVEFRQDDTLGVLRVELRTCSYAWSFLPVGGADPLDAGVQEGTC